VRLTAAAEADFHATVRWSAQQFGDRQARTSATTISRALEALVDGPDQIGVRRRPDIGMGLMTLHVARAGRKGRHFVLFRQGKGTASHCIEVLRLLHDAMDLPQHLPAEDPRS
jgi:toxin ParE1/3/4